MTPPVRFAEVFTDALRGADCTVVGLHPETHLLDTAGWHRAADRRDRRLLAHCRGITLDIGCGPGRMAAHLASRGVPVLGIDLVEEAVALTRARGVPAMRRDVFGPLPAECRWQSALLADGNIGIGGDPLLLLTRVHDLVAPGGRIVCDLAAPGTGLRSQVAHLECGGRRSRGFRWALVAPEVVPELAGRAGLRVETIDHHEGRWFAVLTRATP